MSVNAKSHSSTSLFKTPATRLLILALLAIAIIVFGVQNLTPSWERVKIWNLGDNDDAMRILQVRDWLAGQAWLDVSQHRLTAHPVSNIHWSRFSDLPLAATMLITNAIFGPALGEKVAAFLTPLWLGAVYFFLGIRAAMTLGGNKALVPAIVMVLGAPAILAYFTPGRVDHHGLQIILLIAALWGLLAQKKEMAAFSGVAIAIGIAIGLETLPMQLVLIGWVAIRWALRGQEVASQTRWFAVSLGLALIISFAITVPAKNWALPINDAIGRGHVVLGFSGGMLLALATSLSSWRGATSKPVLFRLVVLAAIGVLILAGVRLFPELIVSPFAKLDPFLTRVWLNNVSEAKPLITATLSIVLGFAVFPVFAGFACLGAMATVKGPERDLWALAGLTILVAVGLAIFWQLRTSGLAAAVSVVFASALLGKLAEQGDLRRTAAIALVLNPYVPSFIGIGVGKLFEKKETKYTVGGGAGCYTEQSFAILKQQNPGLIIAPIDMGARILLTTPHRVLAAPYHRNISGNLTAYRIFMAKADKAKDMVRAAGGDYLAICTKSAEIAILSREGPGGLITDLTAGRVPTWLIPLPRTKGSDIQAYKVRLDGDRIGG